MPTNLESFFALKENNTTVKKEFFASLASFLAISYIIIVNPKILAAAGMPSNALITSTILVSALGTIMIGLLARNPFIIAPGMGMNTFFSYTAVKIYHLPWQTVLGATFWSGVIFSILVLLNIRVKIMLSLPIAVKQSLGAGIGLFVAYIGLINGGLIATNGEILSVATISSHNALFLICLATLLILFIKKAPAPVIITIITGCLLAIFLNILSTDKLIYLPKTIIEKPDFSLIGQINFFDGLKLSILPTIFTFCFLSLFDGTGSISSLYNEMGQPQRLNDKKLKKTFLADSITATLSGVLGSSPTTVTVESGVGIAQGGRTGLTAVFAGLMFLYSCHR